MKTIDYYLETAYLDWSSVRIQMVIGMLAVFSLCFVNFVHQARLLMREGSLQAEASAVCPNLLNGLVITDFILFFASCLLTALIALEITGHFGNRLGAISSIWAALLFAILNGSITVSSPALIVNRALSLFIMLAVFLFLRTKEKKNLILVLLLAGFCLGFYLDNRFGPGFSSLALSQMFFANRINSIGRAETYLLAGACFIAGVNLLIRIGLRTIDFEAIAICFGCLFLAVILANFKIFDYSIWQKQELTSLYSPSLITARAAFAIGFSLCCLPSIDSSNIRLSRFIGYLGIVALVMLVVLLEKLFTS